MRIARLQQLTDGYLAAIYSVRLRAFHPIHGWVGMFCLRFQSRFFVCRRRLDTGTNHQQQLRNGCDKRVSWIPQKGKPETFKSDREYKAVGVDVVLPTSCEQPQNGLGGSQSFSSAGPLRPGEHLQGLCEEGQVDGALDVLLRMDQEGTVPSVPMYRSVLKACTKRKALVQAKRVHAHLAKHGLESVVSIGEYVVSTLVKCSGLEDALQVFHRLPHRTVFSWTAVISGYAMAGLGEEALRMYHRMQDEGVQPNTYTFVSLLKACGILADLETGRRIHAEVMKHRCEMDVFVSTCLVDMYGKCGSVLDAEKVFHSLSHRHVVLWNAMLAAYIQQGEAEKALQLYEQVREEGVSPDARTFVSALQACGMLAEEENEVVDGRASKVKSLEKVKAMHADARRKGCVVDVFLASTLISMYGKCGSILEARNVFDGLSHQDVVSWNAMLTAYLQQGEPNHALQLYEQMVEGGVQRDVRTFVSVLHACSMFTEQEESTGSNGQSVKQKTLKLGKEIHVDARRCGCDADVFVGNSLISMYGKCGSIVDAQKVFDGLSQRDVVSWNALLMAYCEQGQAEKALQLYAKMQKEYLAPNEITFLCLLQACTRTGSLNLCKQVHADLVSTGNPLSPLLATTLMHAYGACASMESARAVFDALPQADVVSWNALIAAYARQGNGAASLQAYKEMQAAGTKPDGVTFLSLLSVCSHAGLVIKGIEFFESMRRDHGIVPGVEHYGSMIDLLVRTGDFARLEQLISSMPVQPDLAMWSCVLGACRKHGKVVLGRQAFDRAIRLQPKHSAPYLLMSGIYNDAGYGDSAKAVKKMRLSEGAWKVPGQSWVEHEQEVHTFLVRDSKHVKHEQLYGMLGNITSELAKRQTPQKLDEQCHSEKLAMAFGLLTAKRMRSGISHPGISPA